MPSLKAEIKFGTDGWRAIISDTFTFKNVRRVAQAIADYYNGRRGRGKVRVAVGYDTRFLSDKYARLVGEVLADNGIEVIIADSPVPTPMLSFAVKRKRLTAGVMITASHNPASYNGIKIKTASGGAAGVEVTSVVERSANRIINPRKSRSTARVTVKDLAGDYVRFLRSYVNLAKMKKAGYRVLVDTMHGSGNGFIELVLAGTGVRLEFNRRERNPSFGGLRPEPIPENLACSIERMKREKFDICLVLDGDADRIAAIAPGGEFISPQKILALLALHLYRDRGFSGGVVKTIVGTNLLDNLTRDLGLKLYETPVGFKYISYHMEHHNIMVGGEEAGGIGFKNYIPERDGTLAGILLLEMMAYRRRGILRIISDMERKYGRYYYLKESLRISGKSIDVMKFRGVKSLLGKKVVEMKDYDGVKLTSSDGSWLMLRGSGTEPLIRIYAESRSLQKSRRLLELGRRMALNR
ncbi:MAG: phosphoglucomutase/phosphomannomutase family protein [Candidatus Omnitrophota bacterium]